MNEHRTPRLLRYYSRYLDTLDSATFIDQVSQSYYAATLERLAKHGGVNERRAAVLALTYVGDFSSNAALGSALWDPDRGVRMIAEDGIGQIWLRDGSAAMQQAVRRMQQYNANERFEEAIDLAERLIDESPWLAESYHQLATARFELEEYHGTLEAAAMAVELNPYHFSALSKMGKSYLVLGETTMALDCFERALRLNPNREDYRVHISRLRRSSI